MIIVKLGGSLITDKSKAFVIRGGVLRRLSGEIKRGAGKDLIIIHGGGSFGHPIANKYMLQRGFQSKEQLRGVYLTRLYMDILNRKVLEALTNKSVPAISIQSSANIICDNGRINEFNIEIVDGFIKLGLVPVMYGDVVLDKSRGFCILSGDQIVSHLAMEFDVDRVILATDVDGVYTKDPKKFEEAKFIKEISKDNTQILDKLEISENDVTGGLKGKIIELLKLAEKGTESIIINGLVKGRLEKAILGERVLGTKVF